MGDYGGSYDHIAEEKVKYVVNEDQEDWSGMQNTRTQDDAANAAEEGQYYYEDGINYEVEYSYSCESSQQVAREGAPTSGYGHRRVRSAFGGHKSFLLEDDQIGSSAQSSEKEEYVKVKTVKPKTKKKGVSRQFEHLQEPSLDTHSDPGYGDDSYEAPDFARSQSINLVSSWLQDASLGEHLNDDSETPQYAQAHPARRPPPRRHPPRADMVGPSSSLPNHHDMGHYDHYETYPADVQYNDKTPPYDPASGYQYYPEARYEDNQLAIYDPSLSSESIYRLEQKPLDKAFKFMKSGAVGFANVSKTAAVGIKTKSIEFKNLAIPVMKPILYAVLEESKEQLMGPDRGRGRSYPLQRPNSAQLDRMATPYVPALGRGRGPMQRPPMMRPGMPPGQRPVIRPGMPAGQRPLMRPSMRPGMPPQGAVPPMAVSAARGQGVAMRGQPRPRGRARPVAPQLPA